MKYIGVALLIAAGFALLTLGLAFLLFRLAFGARKTTEKEMFALCAPSRRVESNICSFVFICPPLSSLFEDCAAARRGHLRAVAL